MKLWNRNFTLLIAATTMGAVGGIAGGFALSFLVFDETGSTLASALMGVLVGLLSRWLPDGRLWTILIVLVGVAAYAAFALLTGAVQKSDLAPLLRRGKKGAE